jgi:hypothetical protein
VTCFPRRSDPPGKICRPPPCRRRRPDGALRWPERARRRARCASPAGRQTDLRPGDAAETRLAPKVRRSHHRRGQLTAVAETVDPMVSADIGVRRRVFGAAGCDHQQCLGDLHSRPTDYGLRRRRSATPPPPIMALTRIKIGRDFSSGASRIARDGRNPWAQSALNGGRTRLWSHDREEVALGRAADADDGNPAVSHRPEIAFGRSAHAMATIAPIMSG